MGHRTTQRILECSDCGRTPDDGEYMWEMNGEYICVTCIEKDECDHDWEDIGMGRKQCTYPECQKIEDI